jgi:hypothetical protein
MYHHQYPDIAWDDFGRFTLGRHDDDRQPRQHAEAVAGPVAVAAQLSAAMRQSARPKRHQPD